MKSPREVFEKRKDLIYKRRLHLLYGCAIVRFLKLWDKAFQAYEDLADDFSVPVNFSIDHIRSNILARFKELTDSPTEHSVYYLFQASIYYRSPLANRTPMMDLFWKVYPPKSFEGDCQELYMYWKQVGKRPSFLPNDVLRTAEGIYQNRTWDGCPILADHLEDYGCSDPKILDTLRKDKIFRGHWLMDLIIGKGYKEQYSWLNESDPDEIRITE